MKRSTWTTRKTRRDALHEELVPGTAGERIQMVWQLTRDAWAFAGIHDEPRLQRHLVRAYRRGR